MLQGAVVLVLAGCHTCCTQTSFRYCTTAALRVHASTCREKNLATAWKDAVLSLTYNREHQQDAADNDGDNDRSLSSPKVQHGNCVVELSNLDLRKETEAGEAGAEQQVAKGLGAGRTQGSPPQTLTRGLGERAGTAPRLGGRQAGLCQPLPEPGHSVPPGSPIPVLCSGECQDHTQQAVVLHWCPPQCQHRALVAELQAPWPHCICPRRGSPFLESPWHCTRLPVLLLLENHFH